MPFSTEELRQKLAGQTWTASNIRLNDEISTYPLHKEFLLHDERLKALYRTFTILFPASIKGRRVADLGSLEGSFSLALAQKGADVVGFEARAKEIEKANLLKEHFELPNMNFIQTDVKEFSQERFGRFDLVLALGIIYHLDNPVRLLHQIAGATDRLIVDTHLAPANDEELAQINPQISNLSSLEEINSRGRAYEGRWFFEFPEDADREAQIWASYSNNRSFWLTKESLLLAIYHAGFDMIFEQHDWTLKSYHHFLRKHSRAMFVALKSATLL